MAHSRRHGQPSRSQRLRDVSPYLRFEDMNVKKAVKKPSAKAGVKKATIKDLSVRSRSGGVNGGVGRGTVVGAIGKIAVEWKSL